MGTQTPKEDILDRLCKAEREKNWAQVSDTLDHLTVDDDIDALLPVIPHLIEHHDWLVRASAVEMAGAFRLRQFTDLVKARLEDHNSNVKAYALEAYYDLLGSQALPTLRIFCKARNLGVRVTALSLCYVATGDDAYLANVEKIVLKRDCDYRVRYAVLNTLDHYLDISANPRAVRLFRSILKTARKSEGIAKDLRKKVLEWEGASPRRSI